MRLQSKLGFALNPLIKTIKCHVDSAGPVPRQLQVHFQQTSAIQADCPFPRTLDAIRALHSTQETSIAKMHSTTFVFGSQDLDINAASLEELRQTLLDSPSHGWITDAINDLPKWWTQIKEAHPALKEYPGSEQVNHVLNWLRRGDYTGSYPPHNVVTTPLTVITHLEQMMSLIRRQSPSVDRSAPLTAVLNTSIQASGLCTGLLSAAAVASSNTLAELERNGAVAIRLAVAIGALVDAMNSLEWTSLVASWTSSDKNRQLEQILEDHPEAYIAVRAEARQVTITTPGIDASSLTTDLKNAGFVTTKTSLQGAFHLSSSAPDAHQLIEFFDTYADFQFSATIQPMLILDSLEEEYMSGTLHRLATKAMMRETAQWDTLFSRIERSVGHSDGFVVSFGRRRCVPQAISRRLGARLIHAGDAGAKLEFAGSSEDIAVIGMACHVPGGRDIHEFWETLCTGVSQHTEVPEDRIRFKGPWRRNDPERKWFGNFIEDHSCFDHKFFKKTPLEMASTDPQQRLIMQVAYQALAQSGYFASSGSQDVHVGCYIGIGPCDYEGSVADHEATAYTATGNLRSFAAGKISHYFGWSAPGVTIDTACSSSAVAIHEACKAILTGECNAALAGGTNHLSGPEWFQNLAGAAFLSTTGQCKPFDASADGYCRSEGAGALFLKKYSDALKDGDQVLGLIKATYVAQNENCSAITAPTSRSLAHNFTVVVAKSGLEPKQISLVEAHGTGTQVGDKAEYTAIREVFGDGRSSPLFLGSAKGHIGHLESASGVASVIKTLLQMQNRTIPPQASHNKFNPNLPISQSIEIATRSTAWNEEVKTALVNNYGASGSNASLVIAQPPTKARTTEAVDGACKHPFWLSAHTEKSLQAYAMKLARLIRSKSGANAAVSLADLAFAASMQSNRLLDQGIVFSSSSEQDLLAKLDSYASGQLEKSISVVKRPSSRPVILVFGGQTSASVSVSRDIYDRSKLFRDHIDKCDEISSSLGFPKLVPRIFNPAPVQDIVQLQMMLFAVQYASAQSWADSGVQVAAIVGHSFGELVGMCVSGVLSLRDALWMVASRAKVIQENWGNDSGSMLFVEATEAEVNTLLEESRTGAAIACFNGPRSFTIAGGTSEVDQLQEFMASNERWRSLRSKRLTVTNAFHSKLVEPLMAKLKCVGEALIWRDPKIYQERATRDSTPCIRPQPELVATHMRDPVFFGAAVERLAKRIPGAIWLEAGSGSGVTGMASKALGSPEGSFFQPVNLSSVENLVEATTCLWKQGLNLSFWSHHKCQTREYATVLLPAYQFDKHPHWLERKEIPVPKEVQPSFERETESATLWTFLGYSDQNKEAHFSINTASPEFQTHVSAHVIAQTAPICPTGFQYHIATDAIGSLMQKPEQQQSGKLRSELQGMENHSPIVRESRNVKLIAKRHGHESRSWDWRIESLSPQGGKTILHVNGQVIFADSQTPLDQNPTFARYARLVDYQRCKALLDDPNAEQIIQGKRNIYTMFSPMVHYNEDEYKGLHKIVAKGNESAGRIIRTKSLESFEVGLGDAFCQVAGIFANCLADCDGTEMYLSNRLEHWIAPPHFSGSAGSVYEVYARHGRPSSKEWLSDIFVFDPVEGRLLATIFGMGFIKMKISAMSRMLSNLTGARDAPSRTTVESFVPSIKVVSAESQISKDALKSQSYLKTPPSRSKPKKKAEKKSSGIVEASLRGVLSNMLGVEDSDITPKSDLIDLGVDSLLAMELARDVQKACNVELDTGALLALTDFQSLVDAVKARSGAEVDHDEPGSSDTGYSTEVEEENVDSGYETPATPPLLDESEEISSRKEVTNTIGKLALSTIVSTFEQTKAVTDDMIRKHKLSGFSHGVLPTQNELVVVHIMDAFEKLGCNLRLASPGQVLPRVSHLPRHTQLVDVFYKLLEKARVIDLDPANGTITRTTVPTSSKTASALLEELLKSSPEHGHDHKLTSLLGNQLAECLQGDAEGVQILFGNAENRALVSASYADSPIHSTMVNQLSHFFSTLVKNHRGDGPLKIMELGAGTGGTTGTLLPILAASGTPIQYTVTDLSPGLVAGLRKRFAKDFPFTKFEVVNMADPPAHLWHEQHAILATNCVHATQDLSVTTKNIHNMLIPGGFLVMIEMTSVLPWVDLVFGLTEGWWLFNDGRTHACIRPQEWEETLRANGYGYIDWTEGNLPESGIQQIIIAAASDETYHRKALVREPRFEPTVEVANCSVREEAVKALVSQHVHDFTAPKIWGGGSVASANRTVLVTGATGSLGAHLVEHFATQPNIDKVICLNRESHSDARSRQFSALESRGIHLSETAMSKLHVLESDTSKPQLGLSNSEYIRLAMCVTDVVHNAWPMSLSRKLPGFINQFKTMRNLINLARICRQSGGPKIGFQLIGSVATVGYHPYVTGHGLVPEEEMDVASAMPIGYADAKLVCEKMLQQTLRQYPDDFRAMTVRLGQIAGSRVTGGWNEAEHIAQMIKSSQTLKVLPDLQGDLSWCPVNDIAAALSEVLLCKDSAYAVYHIENPVRQSWPALIRVVAKALGIPSDNIIPYDQWLARVRGFPPSLTEANPAAKILPFWRDDFIRMSCGLAEGGLVLDTKHTKGQSPFFRGLGQLPEELINKYLNAWKESGFLR